jgi:hypothetical protein
VKCLPYVHRLSRPFSPCPRRHYTKHVQDILQMLLVLNNMPKIYRTHNHEALYFLNGEFTHHIVGCVSFHNSSTPHRRRDICRYECYKRNPESSSSLYFRPRALDKVQGVSHTCEFTGEMG